MEKNKRQLRYLVTVALSLFLLAAPGQPLAAAGGEEPLRARLITNKSAYVLGEPVHLRHQIFNWSAPYIELLAGLALEHAETRLTILRDGKSSEPYRGPWKVQPVQEKTLLIAYGQATEAQYTVLYDAGTENNLALPEPGVYQLRIETLVFYKNPNRPDIPRLPYRSVAWSRMIEVRKPDERSTEALEVLLRRPSTLRDLHRQSAGPGNMPFLRAVARDYPDTVYAPYCLFALANIQLFFQKTGDEQKAMQHYATILEKYPDFPLIHSVRLQQARLLRKHHQLNRAAAIRDMVLAESEDNLYRFRKDPLVHNQYPRQKKNTAAFVYWPLFDTRTLGDPVDQLDYDKITPQN